jgi:hypothetical protein
MVYFHKPFAISYMLFANRKIPQSAITGGDDETQGSIATHYYTLSGWEVGVK